MAKYFNKKMVVDGVKFDSKREAHYYLVYKRLEDLGEIWNLKLQTKIDYVVKGKKCFYYKPDFEYDDKDGHHYVDVKGFCTPVFRLKKKIIEAEYGIKIEIVK